MTLGRVALLPFAVAMLTACGTKADISGPALAGIPPGEPIHMKVERTTYGAGAIATVQMTNYSSRTFGYNLCSARSFERLEGEDWVPLPPELRLCNAALWILHPGANQESTTDVPLDAAPGTYRLAVTFTIMEPDSAGDVHLTIRSVPFTIAE